MINSDCLEGTPDLNIPSFKVRIIRRKSTNDCNNEYSFSKPLIYSNNQKKSKIPKIEITYKDLENNYLPIKTSELYDTRPSSSPISVMLKNHSIEQTFKKLKASKGRELPTIQKRHFMNTNNFVVTGKSLKCYDWISAFISGSPDIKGILDTDKISSKKLSSTPDKYTRMHQLMKSKLIKGRCFY